MLTINLLLIILSTTFYSLLFVFMRSNTFFTKSNNKRARKLLFAGLLLFPFVYWLNGLMPYTVAYWTGDRGYYSTFWLSIIFLHGLSGIMALLYYKTFPNPLKEVSFGLQPKALFIFLGVVFIVLGFSLFYHLTFFESTADVIPILAPTKPEEAIVLSIAAILVAPILEEVIYRSVVIKGLMNYGVNKWLALMVSVLLFNAIHGIGVFKSAESFLFYTTGGLILGIAFILSKRLWIPVLIHFLLNLQFLFY